MLIIYTIIIIYRLKVIAQLWREVPRIENNSLEKGYLEKDISIEKEGSVGTRKKIEYYNYKYQKTNEETLIYLHKNIYHNSMAASPVKIIYEVVTDIEGIDEETKQIAVDRKNELVTINLENNTYTKTNEKLEETCESEVEKMMEDWYNEYNFRFKENRLLVALDLRIKVLKLKDGYYISDYDKKAHKNLDSLSVTFGEKQAIFEKITHDREGECNYTKTKYKLKMGYKHNENTPSGFEELPIVQLEDRTLPDLSEYTLVEE